MPWACMNTPSCRHFCQWYIGRFVFRLAQLVEFHRVTMIHPGLNQSHICRVVWGKCVGSSVIQHVHPIYCSIHTKPIVWNIQIRVSSLDTEQPNEIALRHATMCSTDWPICSLVPTLHPHLCCAIQVIWPMAFCWLGTTKKSLNGHQTPFLVRGWGLGTRLCKSLC